MYYIVMALIGLMLSFFISYSIFPNEQGLLKRIMEMGNIFIIGFLICSIPFLYFEKYAVWKVLNVLIGIYLVWVIIRLKKNPKKRYIERFLKDEKKVILFLLCSIPLIWLTTEDITTISDQGSYFLHTAVLIEEKSQEVKYSFHHNKVEDAEILAELIELQNDNGVFYKGENGEYSLHAFGTWCSFAALFGKMFGVFNCMKVGIVFYILTILNMYYVCKKLSNNTYAKYFSLFLFGASPIILYIAKAGLTECFSMFFFVSGIRYLLENTKKTYIMSGVFLGMLGFLHISMFIYVPIITISIFLFRIYWDEDSIGVCNIIQLGMYAISLWYAYKISPVYVERQFERFTLSGVIPYSVLFGFISIIAIVVNVIQIPLIYRKYSICMKTLLNIFEKNFRVITTFILIIIIFRTIYFGYCLGYTDKFAIPVGYDAGSWNLRSRYINTGVSALSYLNITNIGRATGIIGLVIFLIVPLAKKDNETSLVSKCLYIMGLYGMLFWTAMQVDTPFNYYASRYFVPFLLPMITIYLSSVIQNKNIAVYIMMIAFMFFNHFHYAFFYGAPKIGQHQVLKDAMMVIPKESTVFCNPESKSINVMLTNSLRILNDCTVYNLKSIDKVPEGEDGECKYIITETELNIEAQQILHQIYDLQYSFGNGKNGSYDTYVGTYELPLYIYEIKK